MRRAACSCARVRPSGGTSSAAVRSSAPRAPLPRRDRRHDLEVRTPRDPGARLQQAGHHVRAGRDRLRLHRGAFPRRPLADLERHHTAEVVLQLDVVHRQHAAVGRDPGDRAAIPLGRHAEFAALVRELHERGVLPPGRDPVGARGAERPLADEAVAATAGLVLRIGTRVVNAPFYSTCGGETAAAEEVWRTGGESHLHRVSDRIPGTDRFYCDIAPRFAWTRAWTAAELDAVVRRYLGAYAAVGGSGPGKVTDITIEDRTPSGRVGTLVIRTDRGSYRLRGNDSRSVLRSTGGELLNSSYFSVTTERDDGRLVRAVIRGNGYGHGVGMCQWGAIGRARTGQDVRTILRTYYPGTIVGPVPPGQLTP